MDYTQIKTGKDLVDAGFVPKTAKEKLALFLGMRIRELKAEGKSGVELYAALYPTTIAPVQTAEEYTRALVAGCDTLLFGPPGSGKTNLINDTLRLFPNHIYRVKGCEMQCNPFSLFDPEFVLKVQPCPKCKDKYGGEHYQQSGHFSPRDVNPGKVEVEFMYVRDGFGISRVRGSPDTYPEDLAGKIDIKMLEEIGDPFHREVFKPGKLSQGNNGIVNINEIGKIPVKTQDTLLDALSEHEVKPSNTRESVPSLAVFLCDTNTEDLDRLSGPLNDRLIQVFFPYPSDTEQNYLVMLRNFYKARIIAAQETRNIWDMNNHALEHVPMPVPLEKAICAAMIDYRNTPTSDKIPETGSNRVLMDALRIARANALIDGRQAGNANDAKIGLRQAVKGRIRARNRAKYEEFRINIESAVNSSLKKRIDEEAKKYWCEFSKENGDAEAVKEELRQVMSGNNWQDVSNGKAAKAAKFWKYVAKTTPFIPEDDESKTALLKGTAELVG